MPMTVTIEEAKNDLPQLLSRLKAGEEEVIIEEDGKPIARLLPVAEEPNGSSIPSLAKRVPGTAIGKVIIPPEFYDPLPDDIVDAFYQ